jgi:long-chain acyl-CoA synthetase
LTDELKGQCDGVKIYTLTDVINAGKENILEYPEVTPDMIAFFSYTSGTTGTPKGAMISHRNVAAGVGGAEAVLPFENGWTHISYLPLAHVFERIVMLTFINAEGRYGIFSGDVRKITEDLAILKPDIFVSVPRLFNKFYDKIQAKMRAATGVKAFLANKALASKEANYESGGYFTHKMWDKLVFSKMQGALGGNVKYMLTGSAPISSDVRKFMKICFACPFAEGYGQTEGLGGQFVTDPNDPEMGHVGGPIPHVEFKLLDVPEMNYFSTDKDADGNLAPRGEILSRSACIIPGYYKNKAKTDDTIDSEGFLHSGDIGMILPNGALKIIDRRKNIFKLSIGEYIAPDKLQEIYKTVRGVSDIFVYGDSLKSVLVAIVFSEEPELKAVASELGIEGTHEELTQNADINKWFVEQLLAKQKESGLKGFERIKKINISPQSFEELELLTTTFKIKRHVAKNHFQATLDELYVGLN